MPANLIAAWFSHLNDTTGINFTIFYDSFDGARFLKGFLVTLELCGVTLFGSVLVGILGAWAQGARLRWVRGLAQGYIHIFRNTPPLVQMYFFYFGLSALLPKVTLPVPSKPLTAMLISLTLNVAPALTEVDAPKLV